MAKSLPKSGKVHEVFCDCQKFTHNGNGLYLGHDCACVVQNKESDDSGDAKFFTAGLTALDVPVANEADRKSMAAAKAARERR